MPNSTTTTTAPLTAAALEAAYRALPDTLRPFYAYLHGSSAVLLDAVHHGCVDKVVADMTKSSKTHDLANVLALSIAFTDIVKVEAKGFDRAALTQTDIDALVVALANHCRAGEGQSPLVVALDGLFGGLMADPDFAAAESPETALDRVLADRADARLIADAFDDLTALLDRLFDFDPNAKDFPGSFIELPDACADVRSMTQSTQHLSAQTRGFFAWVHGAVHSLAFGLTGHDPAKLERRLLDLGVEPLFVRAVLDQMTESAMLRDVLADDERDFRPFGMSLTNLEKHLAQLRSTFAQSPELHPLDRAVRLLVTALAGAAGCRPEDLDSTLDATFNLLPDEDAANFGLAVTFAAEMAGIELVKTVNAAATLWDSFSKACTRAEQCRLCGTLSFALRPAMTFIHHKDALLPALERARMEPKDFEEILTSLEHLSDFLLSFRPNRADQDMINALVNDAAATQAVAMAKAESFQTLLLDTLSHMDPHHRETLSTDILHLAFLLGAMHSLAPDMTSGFYTEAFPDLPNAPVLGFLSCEVLFAAQALAEGEGCAMGEA